MRSPKRMSSASSPLPTLAQHDVSGTVNLANPSDVADAVCAILSKRYHGADEGLIRQSFKDIEDAFWGRYPGLLACDTPYHDLRHSLSTALLTARLVDGYEATHPADVPELGRDEGTLAVLLALFHDIGFLRRDNEAHINGASLVHEHEQRSVDFMRDYLLKGAFACYASQADLIHATDFEKPIVETLRGLPKECFIIGQMLGTADLVCQIAGRFYIERCRDFLFQEFVAAGVDRKVTPQGETVVLYASPTDLLRKTPDFYEHVVKRRLDEDFAQVYRYIAPHFGGDDPYSRAIQNNLKFLRELIAQNDFSGLRRMPRAMMPEPEI